VVITVPPAFPGHRVWSDTVDSRRAIPASLAHAESHGAELSGAWAVPDTSADQWPDARIALPPPALRLEPGMGAADDDGLTDSATLSALLYYAVGLTSHDPDPRGWPLHRAVASARCLYPTECYLLLPGGSGIAEGVYRYDAAHHHLQHTARFEPGRITRLLDGLGARAAVLVTSRPERTAHLYGDYAPRLCVQEAGMVLGAVHLTAVAMGLGTEIHQAPDTLSALCDGWLDAEIEHPMAALALGPGSTRAATSAEGSAEASTQWVPPDIAAHIRARHSGPRIFDPLPESAPHALFDELALALAASPLPDVSAYLCAHRVAGVVSGVYRAAAGDVRWTPVVERDVVADLERIGQTDGRVSLNFRSSAAVVYLAVPRARAIEAYGDDAFRRVHLAAGAVAHRITVAAACHGLAARVHNGYDADAAHRLLGLSDPGETVVFQVAIGRVGDHAGLRLPVVF
jgi:SagB-type dehydrogenase family enzyme